MKDRKYFYELVDNIPEHKLIELERSLLYMAMPEEELTEEELAEIKAIQQEIANGEYVMFETFEEMEQYFLNDEEDEEDSEKEKEA